MKKLSILLLVFLPFYLFSQVKLVSSDATKVYPDDTRITYMELSDYPSDAEFLQFVEKEVLQNRMIQRFSLYPNGTTCFFHSQKDITEDMIVEEINDAYYLYYTTEAYKPSKEIEHKTVSKGDSEKENVRQVNNKTVSKDDSEKEIVRQPINKSVSKESVEKSSVRQYSSKEVSNEDSEKAVVRQSYDNLSAKEETDKSIEKYESNEFKNRGLLNEYFIARFFLDIDDDKDLVKIIINEFKESGFISDVNYNGNSYFEVYSLGMLYPDQIESLLKKWDIKIQKESLK